MAEARYDAVADFYATAFDELDEPASAALLDLLGPPAGLRVLDIACGHGRLTRELARRGAVVTGADISGALIGRAGRPSGQNRSASVTCTPTWPPWLGSARRNRTGMSRTCPGREVPGSTR